MTQGMFSAVTGIKTSQVRMDVISDNIANLNTVAFKSSMVNFKNVFSRTLTAGTAPIATLGGTNPQQVGLGVMVGEIGRDFTQGNVQTTGRSGDLNIQGEGFFVVERASQAAGGSTSVMLTRAGNFTLDASGNMVNPDGLRVIGTDELNSVTTTATDYVRIPRRMNIDKTIVGGVVTAVDLDDSTLDGGAGSAAFDVSLSSYSVGKDGAIEATYSSGDRITVQTDLAGTGRELIFYPAEGGGGLTTATGITVLNAVIAPHELQVQFATVTNNAGLVSVGGNLFEVGVNSGSPTFSIARMNGVGICDAGSLESSNVDLTREFSLLMLSQRALEANGRSFDAHNSVLQTIVNLAR